MTQVKLFFMANVPAAAVAKQPIPPINPPVSKQAACAAAAERQAALAVALSKQPAPAAALAKQAVAVAATPFLNPADTEQKDDKEYEDIVKIIPNHKRLNRLKLTTYPAQKVVITRCQICLYPRQNLVYPCLIFPTNTFIRLPDNHSLRQLDSHIIFRRGGIPMKTIGVATTIEHLPWSKIPLKTRQWLMARFSNDEITKIFNDDILNELGKTTNKNWVNLRYDIEEDADWFNMNPVSLPIEYRTKDCDNAISAIKKFANFDKKDDTSPAKRSIDDITAENPDVKRTDTKQDAGAK